MKIGDLVTYANRLYILRGLDPMSVRERCAVLEDVETGQERRAPLDDVRPRGKRKGSEPGAV